MDTLNIMRQHCVYFGGSRSQGNDTKIGKSSILHNRKTCLDTGYSRDGFEFNKLIFCDSPEQESKIEEFLHSEYYEDSTTNLENHSGGREWFNKQFTTEEVQQKLTENGYTNKVIDDPEIIKKALEEFIQIYETNIKNHKKKMKKLKEDREKNKIPKIILKDFQNEAKTNLINHYETNNKGVINWICGLGKTIFGIDIINHYNFNKIIIGVPGKVLLYQWKQELEKYTNYKIYLNGDGQKIDNDKLDEKFIIITTFSSSNKLIGIDVDFKIIDEMHHIVYDKEDSESQEDKKTYRKILNIKSKKQLGLTATLRYSEKIVGNDNIDVWGKIIDSKSLLWAIDNKHLVDYEIICPLTEQEIVEDLLEDSSYNIDLVISCYQLLQHIKKSNNTHIINYCNKIPNAKQCEIIINNLLKLEEFSELNIYNVSLTSEDNKNRHEILSEFKNHRFAIINCCYILGVGYNEPVIDCVCISENMTSTIRIIQSCLRAHRKDKNNPNKKSSILIPVMYKQDEDYEIEKKYERYSKVWKVLELIGIEDENICEKINFMKETKKSESNPSFYRTQYEDLFNIKMKLKIFHRNLKLGYNDIQKYIKRNGGRDPNKSLKIDFIDKKICSIEQLTMILNKNKKSYFDLYCIDISEYPEWNEFRDNYCNLYTLDEYRELCKKNINIPNINDLDELYSSNGYNMESFKTIDEYEDF